MSVATQTMSLNFTVDGDYLTNFFREQVLSGDWLKALEGIKASLIGITSDQAIPILTGDKRLEGINDLMYVDDHAADYKEELEYQFGDMFRHTDGKIYRPYAIVTDYGDEDRVYKMAKYSREDMDYTQRSLFYAKNPTCDISVRAEIVVASLSLERMEYQILCELVYNPPYWIKPHNDFHTAFLSAQESNKVGLIGYKEIFFDAAVETCESIGLQRDTDAQEFRLGQEEREEIADKRRSENLKQYFKAVEQVEEDLLEIDDYKALILEQNTQYGGEMYTFDFEGAGGVGEVEIPMHPLYSWALERTKQNILQKWVPMSPPNIKMMSDNRAHTDWMVGAGLDIAVYEDEDFKSKQYVLLQEVQQKAFNTSVTVLVAGKSNAIGETIHPTKDFRCTDDHIAIIPNASIGWYECIRGAAGVIVEAGGALSHLAVVGLEEGFLVLIEKDARNKYKEGLLVCIDAKNPADTTIEIMMAR